MLHALREGGDDLVATVVEQSTHKFMSAEGNHTKFDDHLIVEANDRANSVVRSQKLVGKVNHERKPCGIWHILHGMCHGHRSFVRHVQIGHEL